MQNRPEAVIFDMDGVLIDSEPLWRRAMMKGFAEAGMLLSEEDCRKTMGLRFPEVIRHWITLYKKNDVDPLALEERVMTLLLELIDSEGTAIDGIAELIGFCSSNGLRMGLATSSSHRLMQAVLRKLNLQATLQAAVSAEHLTYGKPHPEVFLLCAGELGIQPQRCVVIEDSLNGVIAGKAAQMLVVAVPEEKFQKIDKFVVADHTCNSMREVLTLFTTLFGRNGSN